MQHRNIAALLLIIVLVVLLSPISAFAAPPQTGLESLVNEWRAESGASPLQVDERLYTAAQEVAGDGTYCPQDRMFIEFVIGGALYRSGYHDRRGYGLLLCGEYTSAEDVINWIRERGGPGHPDLKDIGVVHLNGLDFVRSNGTHVSDIWVLLAAAPMD